MFNYYIVIEEKQDFRSVFSLIFRLIFRKQGYIEKQTIRTVIARIQYYGVSRNL